LPAHAQQVISFTTLHGASPEKCMEHCVLQDLSGGNVLLTSSAANSHGFTARVVDFGLARSLVVKARTAPGRYGTITHMAPETIREGELSIACDVYAWGVQLWEMITGGLRQHDCLSCCPGYRGYGCRQWITRATHHQN
jgi:serine/threonine protein kinase